MTWRRGRGPLVEAGLAPFGKTCSWKVGLGSRSSWCVLVRGHDGPHRGLCGARAAGDGYDHCLLPKGHDGPHRATSHIVWGDGDGYDEMAEGQAALGYLIESGVLIEERDDAGRVRHVTDWSDADAPSYEHLRWLRIVSQQEDEA